MMVLRLNTLLEAFWCNHRFSKTTGLLHQSKNYTCYSSTRLGASGDLAPLSHLALALIGEGNVFYKGEEVDSRYVLNQLNHKALELQAKEGLALINGTQAMTAQGVINYIEAEDLGYQAEWIASLTHQALNGITGCL